MKGAHYFDYSSDKDDENNVLISTKKLSECFDAYTKDYLREGVFCFSNSEIVMPRVKRVYFCKFCKNPVTHTKRYRCLLCLDSNWFDFQRKTERKRKLCLVCFVWIYLSKGNHRICFVWIQTDFFRKENFFCYFNLF